MSKKIILNTIITYSRTVLAAAIGLFTARWVLLALGEEDYGLFGVVGSLLVFITFTNNVLAGSVARYFAFTIGQKNDIELNRWFNAAFYLHILVPLFFLVLGIILGPIFIRECLNIPKAKIDIACIVFYISIISALFSMISSPFKGMLLAKQDIMHQSIIEIFQSIVHLGLMFVLTFISNNTLLIYTIFMAVNMTFFQFLIVLRAMKMYKELSIKKFEYKVLKSYMKELLYFSTWKSIDGIGRILYSQGTAVLLNLFWGTKLNAAYTISTNVSAQSASVSNSMLMAITPEIVSREGNGDSKRMKTLSIKASKYSTYLVFFLAIPLLIDLDNILIVWLRNPPQYTAQLCSWIIGALIIEKMASGHDSALNAKGRIASFQTSIGLTYILSMPLSYILLSIYNSPIVVGLSFVLCQLLALTVRLYYGAKIADIKIIYWFKNVFFPILLCFISVYIICCYISFHITFNGLIRFICIVLISGTLLMLYGWFFLIEKDIRQIIISRLKKR